jgi:D-alanyl-D-alanine carboxypeptidase
MKKDLIRQITSGNFDGEIIQYAGITHYKYSDCDLSQIVTCCKKRVHKTLAQAFRKMRKDAQKEGIELFLVSGFRSIHYQKSIFPYKFKNKKNPSEEEFVARLKYSAPAGFSEHHTGLAIDINSLEEDFADTKEYEWLLKNAKNYGFEMSFPKNNKQGLGFEPWHWRYVGTEDTKKIFAQAKN